jgi:hypothetical protein
MDKSRDEMKEYEKLELERWSKLALVCIARKGKECKVTDEICDMKKCIFYQWVKYGF